MEALASMLSFVSLFGAMVLAIWLLLRAFTDIGPTFMGKIEDDRRSLPESAVKKLLRESRLAGNGALRQPDGTWLVYAVPDGSWLVYAIGGGRQILYEAEKAVYTMVMKDKSHLEFKDFAALVSHMQACAMRKQTPKQCCDSIECNERPTDSVGRDRCQSDVNRAVTILKRMTVSKPKKALYECDNDGSSQRIVPLDQLRTQQCAELLFRSILGSEDLRDDPVLRSILGMDRGEWRGSRITLYKIDSEPMWGSGIKMVRVGDDSFQVYYHAWNSGSTYG